MNLVLEKLSKIEEKLSQPNWTEQQIRTATTIDDYCSSDLVYSKTLTDLNDGYDPLS